MIKWITIDEACDKYQLSILFLFSLINKKIVIGRERGPVYVINESNLIRYLEATSPLCRTSLLELFFKEMKLLIANEQRATIFYSIGMGVSITELTQIHNMPSSQIRSHFTRAIKEIQKRSGFISDYRNEKATLLFKLRKAEIELKNNKEEIRSLREHLFDIPQMEVRQKVRILKEEDVRSEEIIRILSVPVNERLDIGTRVCNMLHANVIYTVEDFLRFTKKHEIETLLNFKGFGHSALKELKDAINQSRLFDENGNCELYEYVL